MLLKFLVKVHENETKIILSFAKNALAPNIPFLKSPAKMQGETFHKFTSIGLRLTEFQHCIQMIVSFYYE